MPPSSSSAPSVFDRLSQQGTAASKQREADERRSRLRNEQRRQKESAALTPTKNDRKLQAMQRSPVPQDRLKKSPTKRDELYERLAKQETISSAAHHDKIHQDIHHPLTNSPTRTDKQLAKTFNRLYKQDTASSKAHHHKPEVKTFSPKKKVASTPPPSLLTRRLDYKSTDLPIPLQMKVYFRTIEEKKSGKPFNTLDLTQNEIRKQLNLYAASKISARSLAYDIINALFRREFTPGRHWEISSASIEELDVQLDATLMKHGDDAQAFEGMKEAVLDHNDAYSAVKASAKIIISNGVVYVDEYLYYNSNGAKGMGNGTEKVSVAASRKEEVPKRTVEEERVATKKADEAAAAAAVESGIEKPEEERSVTAEAESGRRSIEEGKETERAQSTEEEEKAVTENAEEATAMLQ